MERRDFIRLTSASAAAALIAPAISQADADKPVAAATADIYYTKESLGRWAGKEATHLPAIEISKAADGITVKVVTPHEMKAYEHYIVKPVLLDKNHKFIAEHAFDPSKDSVASSVFTLKDYQGTVYALSMCNKHDLWLNRAEI